MGEGKKSKIKMPSKKAIIILSLLILILAAAFYLWNSGFFAGLLGNEKVEFTQLTKDQYPQAIEKDVIPEYRQLERALGMLVDDKVYVVVTRGQMPTAGYDLSIKEMLLEKNKDGSNLVVTALFSDPKDGEAVSEIITYPYVMAETSLDVLPNTIELVIEYD